MRFGLSVAVCAAVLLAAAGAPTAVADPDYGGYQPVDPKPYQTYNTYGGGGVQFTTPSGLMCRLVIITRGEFAYANCFGPLHGVAEGSNIASIDTRGSGTYNKTTRNDFLRAETVDATGVHSISIPDTGFPVLPVGTAVTYSASVWSGTCAVDAMTTQCTVGPTADKGTKTFVLGPDETTFS